MRQGRSGEFRQWRALALACGLLLSGGAAAENADCARLRAELAVPVSSDPAAAAAARKVRADLDQASAHAHSVGCDNQQFLFFGQAPPPQCGGLKARIAGLRAQFDSLQARASGDSGQRRALVAHVNAACNTAPPREKNFFEVLFGGLGGAPGVERVPETPLPPGPDELDQRLHGGSQALCVRSCDGGFFPLSFSANSASSGELLEMCKALCPNAEVQLFTRNPSSDISTAVSADGEMAYESLPNALKYTKSFDSNCGCKPPNQNWVEALAHAEQLLDEMGGAKASDTIVTEQQSQSMSQPVAARAVKNAADRQKTPAPAEGKIVEGQAPDGTPRQVRVVGPNL
jgi:hypothetical protein